MFTIIYKRAGREKVEHAVTRFYAIMRARYLARRADVQGVRVWLNY